jgi:hypothetical protein
MEQGWDPEIKKFFKKIILSISLGLMWMMASATAGLYFGLAYSNGRPVIYTILFYTVVAITLFLLILYLYKTWKNG